MLTLMSFGSNSKQVNLDKTESTLILENQNQDCFDLADASATQWMLDTGGSFDDSWAVFDAVFHVCEWFQY